MAWEEIDFDKPHLAYMIIGGFTSLFMLCSLFIKERLYIGEATVATIVGVIFGPHAANLFDPLSWGNSDKITLELSRIVLVVQCFAVGVELPKAYMERHWRSVTFLLVPVMTLGWLITSLIIWICISPLTWLESLAVAACVTATDPVLASSVVGKGKFAKRVPKHLRDILSAESGCNDGMAFPFIYLSYYLIHYDLQAGETTFHWIVLIILYECVFGAVYGFTIGYIARHAIKYAERKALIDRDSFLVFYFVLALFCSGSAAGLGLDDLLVGFAAGVGFSNDGWFVEKTEESHVSNVIDLLLNLSYFVYLGAIIPWGDYNNADIGLAPWRLVVIAILVLLFRRIPAMLLLKPLIPDIKNWREALFAGHFGPIGVGAIFAVVLLRAELETGTTSPLPDAELPGPGEANYLLIQVIWPVVTFLVISSILVHGSSIAVFTLGRRINTLTLTLSYTQDQESTWMDRLPRIASRGKSMSRDSRMSKDSIDEKDDDDDFQPGTLGPVGVPRNFLRRQKEEEYDSRPGSRSNSKAPRRRKKRAGGPVDETAFGPRPFWEQQEDDKQKDNDKDDVGEEGEPMDMVEAEEKHDKRKKDRKDHESKHGQDSPEIEAYREGHEMIVEDEEGNILDTRDIADESPEEVRQDLLEDVKNLRAETSGEHAKSKHHPHTKNEGEELEHQISEDIEHPKKAWKKWLHRQRHKTDDAYQYGDKIIVEDADGEVVKTYDIPRQPGRLKQSAKQGEGKSDTTDGKDERPPIRKGLTRMGTWTGLNRMQSHRDGTAALQALASGGEDGSGAEKIPSHQEDMEHKDEDHLLRFRLHGTQRRMSKQDFIKQIQALDPKARVEAVEQTNATNEMKEDVRSHAKAEGRLRGHGSDKSKSASPGPSKQRAGAAQPVPRSPDSKHTRSGDVEPALHRTQTASSADDLDEAYMVDSHGREIPIHDVQSAVAAASQGQPETAAQRRRRLAAGKRGSPAPCPGEEEDDSEDDGTERIAPIVRRTSSAKVVPTNSDSKDDEDDEETPAERKRRLAALGRAANEDDSESEEDGGERRVPPKKKGPSLPSITLPQESPRPLASDRGSERRPPQSPIAEEDDDGEGMAEGEEELDVEGDGTGTPRSPGIRFADMPRGEGRGRSRRFGRTMGTRRS